MNPIIKAFGIVNGLCWLANGALRGFIDYYTGQSKGFGELQTATLSKALLGFNFVRNGFADPVLDGTPGPDDWAAWGTGVLEQRRRAVPLQPHPVGGASV